VNLYLVIVEVNNEYDYLGVFESTELAMAEVLACAKSHHAKEVKPCRLLESFARLWPKQVGKYQAIRGRDPFKGRMLEFEICEFVLNASVAAQAREERKEVLFFWQSTRRNK
jgi:hypothetical protein